MLTCLWKKYWRPDEYYSSVDRIPFEQYANRGYRLVLLDMDNTLMPHGNHRATERVKQRLSQIRQAGLRPVILTNAKRNRAACVAQDVDCEVVGMAMKPSAKGVCQAMRQQQVVQSQVLLVGDQLFTDIWAARCGGVHAILVAPLSTSGEPIQIRLKRCLERWLLKRFKVSFNT